MVYEEIVRCDDALAAWIKERRDIIFKPCSRELQLKVRDILAVAPRLIKVKNNKSMADPWVIAQAMLEDAIVVTNEVHGSNTDIKIPNVCDHFDVSYIDEYTFAERENIFNRR